MKFELPPDVHLGEAVFLGSKLCSIKETIEFNWNKTTKITVT